MWIIGAKMVTGLFGMIHGENTFLEYLQIPQAPPILKTSFIDPDLPEDNGFFMIRDAIYDKVAENITNLKVVTSAQENIRQKHLQNVIDLAVINHYNSIMMFIMMIVNQTETLETSKGSIDNIRTYISLIPQYKFNDYKFLWIEGVKLRRIPMVELKFFKPQQVSFENCYLTDADIKPLYSARRKFSVNLNYNNLTADPGTADPFAFNNNCTTKKRKKKIKIDRPVIYYRKDSTPLMLTIRPQDLMKVPRQEAAKRIVPNILRHAQLFISEWITQWAIQDRMLKKCIAGQKQIHEHLSNLSAYSDSLDLVSLRRIVLKTDKLITESKIQYNIMLTILKQYRRIVDELGA